MSQKVKMALIGGGSGSFIGAVHKMAAELDGKISLAAGCFSSSAERSKQAGFDYGISEDRAYPSFEEMMRGEAEREDGVQLIAIAAPNHVHFDAAVVAANAGKAIICDKPATISLAEALELKAVLGRTSVPYCLTYTYTGYPMIREARNLCASGALGEIRKCVVEYPQGWLSLPIERSGSKQAGWRTDPAKAGVGGCSADIGVHAFNLLEFVTSLKTTSLCAQLSNVVPGRVLDDDCNLLLELDENVPAVIQTSQIAAGSRNGLRIRVWGSEGGLDWSHEQSDRLTIDWIAGHSEIRHAGDAGLSDGARAACRLPTGHPEGFIEALANIYADFADSLTAAGLRSSEFLQGIDEGIRSMAFIENAVRSSQSRQWVDFSVDLQENLQ